MPVGRLSTVGTWGLLCAAVTLAYGAPPGTQFAFQGQLKRNGAPVDGLCDFIAALWNDPVSVNGADMVAGPQPFSDIMVERGMFTLTPDFGVAVFGRNALWLEIEVRCPAGAGAYTTLAPRQPILPAPYALQTRDLYVDDTGDVGIGMTNPGWKLHVAGGVHDGIKVSVPDGSNTSAQVVLSAGSEPQFGQGAIFQLNAPSNTVEPNALLLFNRTNGPLVLGTANQHRLDITPSGDVGIGVTNPSARLHVAGIARFDLGAGRVSMTTPGGWPGLIAHSANNHRREIVFDDSGMRLLTSASDGPSPGFNGLIIAEDGTVSTGNGFAAHADGSVTAAGSFLVNPDGMVGIGAPAPTHALTIGPLDIGVAGRAGDLLRLIGPDTILGYGGRLNFGDGNFTYLEEDIDDGLIINARVRTAITGGRVGVGTIDPQTKLHVVESGGTASIHAVNSGTSLAADLRITNPANASHVLFANTTGLGRAGNFQIDNVTNNEPAVFGFSNGTGGALYGRTSGNGAAVTGLNTDDGYAGYFRVDNSGTFGPAVEIRINGTSGGRALEVYNTGGGRAAQFTNSAGWACAEFTNNGNGNALDLVNSGSSTNPRAAATIDAFQLGDGWIGFWEGNGVTNKGLYISAGQNQPGLQVATGTKSAVVATADGARALYTEESTEVWFTDYGFGRLDNGRVTVHIDPTFAQTVSLDEPYHVFTQLYDPSCPGLAVTNRTASSFEVVEVAGGRSDAEFSYRLVARRRGMEDVRLRRAPWADLDPNLYPERRAEWLQSLSPRARARLTPG